MQLQIADFGMARLVSADGSHASTEAMGEVPGSTSLIHMPLFLSRFFLFDQFLSLIAARMPGLSERDIPCVQSRKYTLFFVCSYSHTVTAAVVLSLLLAHHAVVLMLSGFVCRFAALPRPRELAAGRSDKSSGCVQLCHPAPGAVVGGASLPRPELPRGQPPPTFTPSLGFMHSYFFCIG